MTYGRNATAYQILNPGIQHWFSPDGHAVVGYVKRGGFILVAGEPICERARLAEVTRKFEHHAAQGHFQVCYVLASEPLRRIADDSAEHSTIVLGAQPVWKPADWNEIVRARKSLRAQLHRSMNKGVAIKQMSPQGAWHDVGIQRTLREWLHGRHLPPMHFLVEPAVLAGIVTDRLLFVATQQDRVVAFLVASPAAARNGYLIEELARSPHAPNGTSELLIDGAMHRFAEMGCEYVTMGLVALASGTTAANPLWIRALMSIARAHANRFYNFRGLEKFRMKMHPHYWEKLYAISNEPHFSPQALYAMGGAFSGISPVHAILLAILKGAGDELRTLGRVLSR